MAFSIFSVLDQTFAFVLNIVPFYQLIKLLILIWLQNPIAQGALIVYISIVAPLKKKYSNQIDQIHDAFGAVLDKVTDPFVPPKDAKKQ